MTKLRWLLVAVAVVLLVTVAGPWVYLNVIKDDPPERLSLDDVTTTTAAGDPAAIAPADGDALDGEYEIGAGSVAGYRAREVLFGQDAEAVGRTSDVTGSMRIAGTTVTDAAFTVDLTTISSDEDRRDNQFHGRIMDTATFPTAGFTLTEPVDLGEVPAAGEEVTVSVTGDLTVRDVTRTVTFDLAATRTADGIAVNGAIAVTFADFGIPDPSFGPAEVEGDGEIEVLLVLVPSA